MEKPQFKTGEFEGPLDLLLYLIQKHKLDICDIEISALLEQYLAYIDAMGQDDLEIASEFLEMAARLVYIKTAMLLPRHEEEGVKLKAELQGQLLEYQVCQRVAAQLGALSRLYLNFARQPMKLPADHSYRLTHSPQILYDAYRDAAGRGARRLPPPARAFSGIVARRVVLDGRRRLHILRRLYSAPYESLFLTSTDRSELVATFLAVLELVKARRITVDGGQVSFERGGRARQQQEAPT